MNNTLAGSRRRTKEARLGDDYQIIDGLSDVFYEKLCVI